MNSRTMARRLTLIGLTLTFYLAGCANSAPNSAGALTLFDAHVHLENSITPEEQVAALQKAGLSGAIIFGPNNGRNGDLLTLHDHFPPFIYPFLNADVDNGTGLTELNDATLTYFDRKLFSGDGWGIGELRFDDASSEAPVDGPNALRLYDIAAERGAPITLHYDSQDIAALERALDHNPQAILIWARMGEAQAEVVGPLMQKHPNLYLDLSARNPFDKKNGTPADQWLTTDDGALKPEWKTVFETYPDRVLFGTNLGDGSTFERIDQIVDYYRKVLAQLEPAAAEKIAHANAERLLRIGQ